MNNFKKIGIFAVLLAVLLTTFACGSNEVKEKASANGGYKIGVLQFIQHQALDLCNKGFTDYLDEKNVTYTLDYQNASGEQSACQTIAEKFLNEKVDLVHAIATPAAQSAMAVCEGINIISSAVTDPASSGLEGENMSCASDLTPVEAQFDLLKELIPDAKTVAILYCSSEANSKIQADMAIAAARKRGLTPKEYTIVTSNDIQTVVESMIGNVDVLYVPTDNTVSAGFSTVAQICNDNKLPTIVGEEGMVDQGGYATYGIDYYELGRAAGALAVEVLVNGKKPSDMPVVYLDSNACQRKINEETANILGLSTK